MAQVADFEEGDLTDFDSTTGIGLSAITGAVKNGTYGMQIDITDTTARYGTFTGPTDETLFVAECWIDPNGITMDNPSSHIIIRATGSGTGSDAFISFLSYSGSYGVNLFYDHDGGTVNRPFVLFRGTNDDWHHVLITFKASTSAGADNGELHLYIDGVLEDSVTGIDNDTHDVDTIRFGAESSVDSGTSGPYFMDDCKWGNLTQSSLAGSLTNTGALTKQTNKVVAGAITATGAVFKQTNKVVAGAITNTGALTTVKAVLEKLYVWTAKFRATDSEDPMHAGSDEKRGRA